MHSPFFYGFTSICLFYSSTSRRITSPNLVMYFTPYFAQDAPIFVLLLPTPLSWSCLVIYITFVSVLQFLIEELRIFFLPCHLMHPLQSLHNMAILSIWSVLVDMATTNLIFKAKPHCCHAPSEVTVSSVDCVSATVLLHVPSHQQTSYFLP